MKPRTLWSLVRERQLRAMVSFNRSSKELYRLNFLASAQRHGIIERLNRSPRTLQELADDLEIAEQLRGELHAWLQLGVAVGELRCVQQHYRLSGPLAIALADAGNDGLPAAVEQATTLNRELILDSPGRLRRGETLAEDFLDPALIARSSQTIEPFICEALADVVQDGNLRLLEVGCGSASNIRFAALRNQQLTAVGLELVEEVAAQARRNVKTWGLEDRVTIQNGDVRDQYPMPDYDLVTMHSAIYYFPVADRVELLGRLRRYLAPGGRLLLTTVCQGNNHTAAMLNLTTTMNRGTDRLPAHDELIRQLAEAGFIQVASRALMTPGESHYGFIATNPA